MPFVSFWPFTVVCSNTALLEPTKRVVDECGIGNAGAVEFRAAMGIKVFCTGVELFCVTVGCVERSCIGCELGA